MAPLFSIITVTRNAEDTLPATLRSVATQTCDLYEMILIDGRSTDSTLELARNSGIAAMKIISEPDSGIYDAMNKGLSIATGDYVIFLNAGDALYDSQTLQLIADTAMDNDYPGVIYGQTEIVDADGNTLGPRHLSAPETLTADSFKEGMLVCHQAFIALRKLTTFYNLDYRFSADFDWCIGCLQRSRRNKYIPATLIKYLNEGMTTRNMRKSLRERFDIMCHYYGTIPTILRHGRFLLRYLRRSRAGAHASTCETTTNQEK